MTTADQEVAPVTAPAPVRARHLWHHHPAVRSGNALTLGERAADAMRNGMGSWVFVFAALLFLAVWIGAAEAGVRIDNPQLTILNLVLSCVAALQGAILLIAAKRSDQISSELARHTYDTGQQILAINTAQSALLAEIHALQRQIADLQPPPPDVP